jgi:hypothetical protein
MGARFADIESRFRSLCDWKWLLLGFEKTPQGYLMIFNSEYEQVRAVFWVDPAGTILKDISLPNEQYSVLSFGEVAVIQDGSLYVMSSTKNGIEIHFETAPRP